MATSRTRKAGLIAGGMERGLHERDRVGVQDSVLLEDYTNEEAFIDNLQKRFKENLIYTYIGNVLVSVNPYTQLPIYDSKTILLYNKKHFFENPPHVFAITESAYRSLIEETKDQCVLISGESGSGKTEASKKVLEYITAVSGSRGQVKVVKDKLLLSNPVLEAFGNAKTNRNDNSSRFGKYMDIQFDYAGDPIGGNILNYLLEKSRVVHQSRGERTFHIFYQLLIGGSNSLLESLHLVRDPSMYKYISDYKREDKSIDDASQMKLVETAMNTMGLSTEEQKEIFSIIASILHIGNISIESKEENGIATVGNINHIQSAAQLLGCEGMSLIDALTHRTILAQGDLVKTPLSRDMSVYARDALAKAIYDRLFTWLVSRLNKSLQPDRSSPPCRNVLGILDIYGFEVFEKNSFEQFCINYCNEKLQQLFIELTLKSEQEEYEREGIEWETVKYFNNAIICNLIEEKHRGIIPLLDEECLRPGDTSDMTFLNKITENLSSHQHFISHQKADKATKKKMGVMEFKLVHYAGEVTYNVTGFLDKNNDLLFRDLIEVMSNTSNSITRDIFLKSELNSKKRPDTAIKQFSTSLNKLMGILSTKVPSYIRCIKPNDFKQKGCFSSDIVSHQVTYLGLMENVRVRRAGFAYRRVYEEFLFRYKSLCPATWPHWRGPPRQGVQKIVEHLHYNKDDYRMGNTKIFIRDARTLFETEDAFQMNKHKLAAFIQAHWKGLVARRRYREMRRAAIIIETWVRRLLAKLEAKKRKQAVSVIRNFIEGFITRNGPVTDLNRKFVQSAKQQWLLRLSRNLPRHLLVRSWPQAPSCCQEASDELKKLHRLWLARKYCLAITPERKRGLEHKVLAEELFKGKKVSYQFSVECWFYNSRLNDTQNLLKGSFLMNHAPHEKLVYSTPVGKFDRHGYKKRERILFITNESIILAMEDKKSLKLKHKLPLRAIMRFDITTEKDNFLLIRIPPELIKEKGDLILEVPFVIELLTFIVSVTGNKGSVVINSLENGSITHNMLNGKTGMINLEKGINGTNITKGKAGNLIVVG